MTVKDRHTIKAVPVKRFGNSYLGIKQTKSMSVIQIELSCRIGFLKKRSNCNFDGAIYFVGIRVIFYYYDRL